MRLPFGQGGRNGDCEATGLTPTSGEEMTRIIEKQLGAGDAILAAARELTQ